MAEPAGPTEGHAASKLAWVSLHGSGRTSAAFVASADGNFRLLTAGADGKLVLREATGGMEAVATHLEDSPIEALAVDPTGQLAAFTVDNKCKVNRACF